MKKIVTMRSLLSEKTDRQVLNTLRGLHVGISTCGQYGRFQIAGSMWTISSSEPTIEFVKSTRANLVEIAEEHKRFSLIFPSLGGTCWLDMPLIQHNNWMRKFGPEFVKAAFVGISANH